MESGPWLAKNIPYLEVEAGWPSIRGAAVESFVEQRGFNSGMTSKALSSSKIL